MRGWNRRETPAVRSRSSYAFENGLPGDNERLEFLGDSILTFHVATWLYEQDPNAGEGVLSKRKSALVSRAILGRRAVEMGLGDALRLGKGEALMGGRRRQSLLGSALEALIGAIHLALGFEASRRFAAEHIMRPNEAQLAQGDVTDPKSALQEICLKHFKQTPIYQTIEQTGPDHEKLFIVEVRVLGRLYGQGSGSRKKWAEIAAAEIARERLLEELRFVNGLLPQN